VPSQDTTVDLDSLQPVLDKAFEAAAIKLRQPDQQPQTEQQPGHEQQAEQQQSEQQPAEQQPEQQPATS